MNERIASREAAFRENIVRMLRCADELAVEGKMGQIAAELGMLAATL